ncbi:MAG: hypothetical protein KF884_05605 [Fimbriimonadaceae bacterium]|nr:hypothetical protein [Fimbriimonadaceae bacterium]QYK59560.1 MAG: hypothetical protein KF884_05605 [Fimbriimonadaceae bacterium]
MRVVVPRVTSLIVLAALSSTLAFGQTNVFRCDIERSESYAPTGPTGSFMGQPPVGQWTRLPERGSAIVLADASQPLTSLGFGYLCVADLPPIGTENFRFRVYRNDGPNKNGNLSGTPYRAPGTLLWTSPPLGVKTGDRVVFVPMPGVVPGQAELTVTVHFDGGRFLQVPFDPNDPQNFFKAGGRLNGVSEIGSLPTTPPQIGGPGIVWRRVFTGNPPVPSDWAAQERPATLAIGAFSYHYSLWSGNMMNQVKGIDNTVLDPANPDVWRYLGLPIVSSPDVYKAAGKIVAMETVRRWASSLRMEVAADTLAQTTGSPTFTVTFLKAGRSSEPTNEVLWTSDPQPVPLGLGNGLGDGEFLAYDLPIQPTVLLPGEFVVVFEVAGLTNGATVGPGLRPKDSASNSRIRAGMTDKGVLLRDELYRWDGPFIFGTGQIRPAMFTMSLSLAPKPVPSSVDMGGSIAR